MARCTTTPTCYDRDEVNVCWHPRTANQATTIGKNPAGGATLASIAAGQAVCLQSTRNPKSGSTCNSSPPIRPQSSGGYLWAYYRDPNGGSIYTGWVPATAIGASNGFNCDGPAHADFVCGQTAVCSGAIGGSHDRNDPATTLKRDGYIRYAMGSTAYHWIGSGANVARKCYNDDTYACVQVISQGKYCPDGIIGWIEQDALN